MFVILNNKDSKRLINSTILQRSLRGTLTGLSEYNDIG